MMHPAFPDVMARLRVPKSSHPVTQRDDLVTIRHHPVLPNSPLWDQGDASGVAHTNEVVHSWPPTRPATLRAALRAVLGRGRSSGRHQTAAAGHRGLPGVIDLPRSGSTVELRMQDLRL